MLISAFYASRPTAASADVGVKKLSTSWKKMTGCARPLLSAETQYVRTVSSVIRFLPPLVAGEQMPREGAYGPSCRGPIRRARRALGETRTRSGASTLGSNRQRPAMPPGAGPILACPFASPSPSTNPSTTAFRSILPSA
jgi:hypothetical protein